MGITCGCGPDKKIQYKLVLTKQQSCCGNAYRPEIKKTQIIKNEYWIQKYKSTSAGNIPLVATKLKARDILGGWKVRWGINRMNYRIEPGLYGVGDPNENSPVLVSANYKLTFDKLRKELSGIDAWILILDTKGVNVWCAAGKGTFGTKELIRRIRLAEISLLVSHNKLILPQLGAVGVSAHEVSKATGFNVVYGPVQARDIKEFLNNNNQKNEKMRTMYFPLSERLAIAPMELVQSLKYLLFILIIVALFSIVEKRAFSFYILKDFIPFAGALLTGSLLFPALLPYIPARSFAIKGYILGVLLALTIVLLFHTGLWGTLFYFLVLPPVVSFIALNFTGASTYTSLTGTKLEVSISLPIYLVSILAGVGVRIFMVIHSIFQGAKI